MATLSNVGVLFASFVTLSYLLLQQLEIKSELLLKSLQFALVIAACIFLLPFIFLQLSYHYGPPIGLFLGIGLAYYYIGRVLQLSWWQKMAITLLLPAVSGMLAASVLSILLTL